MKDIIVKLIVKYLEKHKNSIEWGNQTIFMCSTSLFKDMRKAYDKMSEAKIEEYKKILKQKESSCLIKENDYIYKCPDCDYRSKHPIHICPNCLRPLSFS